MAHEGDGGGDGAERSRQRGQLPAPSFGHWPPLVETSSSKRPPHSKLKRVLSDLYRPKKAKNGPGAELAVLMQTGYLRISRPPKESGEPSIAACPVGFDYRSKGGKRTVGRLEAGFPAQHVVAPPCWPGNGTAAAENTNEALSPKNQVARGCLGPQFLVVWVVWVAVSNAPSASRPRTDGP